MIYSDDQSRLLEISIILTEETSALHIDLAKSNDNVEKSEIKAKLTLLSQLQTIIDKK